MRRALRLLAIGGWLVASIALAQDTSAWYVLNRQGDYTNSEAQCYTPANNAIGSCPTIGGSCLIQTAQAQTYTCGDATHTAYSHSYTSGALGTKVFNFTYGTVEVKAKLAGGQGPWPAIWLLGHNCQSGWDLDAESNPATCSWPDAGSDEIDFVEFMDSLGPTKPNQQLHSAGHNDGCTPTITDMSANWHVYQLIWSAGSLVWKIDGSTTCTITQSYVPNSAMFLIITVAMGGGGGGSITDGTLPQSTYVDYISVKNGGGTEVFRDDFDAPVTPQRKVGHKIGGGRAVR